MAFNIDNFLIKSHKAKASDIHVNCRKYPSLRINGEIFKISTETISNDDIRDILLKTLPKDYPVAVSDLKDADYIYEIPEVARYRVNYCRDIYGGKFTFRIIPYHMKSWGELCIPEFIKEYANFNNGIVFVTGPTGSGKSTTLASIIELINENRKKHIVTIEDPVEFIYEDKKSIITQRSLGIDVPDFQTGIKYALRQDPDVILIGEIRDDDTLISAIEAAETGHLVFSTLHTNGTIATINRLIGFIEKNNQMEFMKRLAGCVRGIIHQQLVPTVKNRALIPAFEVLTFTSTVVDYVKDGKLHEIDLLMQKSKQGNIMTMNSSLFNLYLNKVITKETAMEFSLEKVEMEQLLRGKLKNTNSIEDSIL